MTSKLSVLQKGGENVSTQWERVNTFVRGVLCFAETVMMKTEWIPVSLSRAKQSRKTVMCYTLNIMLIMYWSHNVCRSVNKQDVDVKTAHLRIFHRTQDVVWSHYRTDDNHKCNQSKTLYKRVVFAPQEDRLVDLLPWCTPCSNFCSFTFWHVSDEMVSWQNILIDSI